MAYVYSSPSGLENLSPSQALGSLSQLLGMEQPHLVSYFPELGGYQTGRVNIYPDSGNFRVVGDLATAVEPMRYFSPTTVRFYTDREKAMLESPYIMEVPQKINVVLEQQAEEQPVYLVRDYARASVGHEEMPAGVIRGFLKRPPSYDDMLETYDAYQQRIQAEPTYEPQLMYMLNRMGSYQPHYHIADVQPEISQYMVNYPELLGYQPAHISQLSRALQARNPLYLRNSHLPRRMSSNLTTEEVLRIALWVAVGIFVGVVVGMYVT